MESGGSGLEKDDSPGNMDLPNTPSYSDAESVKMSSKLNLEI